MIKVAICTPTSGRVEAVYTMSLVRTVLHFLQTPILGREKEERAVITQMQCGANIGANRDNMVDKALSEDCSHVLFVDDDMGFNPECLGIMLARQMPVLLANYRKKTPPGHFTAVEDNPAIAGMTIQTTLNSTSLVPCLFGGFGFCLIETEVLRAIPKPRFLMKWLPEIQTYTTEDVPFFEAVKEAGFPIYVDQEVSKRVWHVGSFGYDFSQELDPLWSIPYPERMK